MSNFQSKSLPSEAAGGIQELRKNNDYMYQYESKLRSKIVDKLISVNASRDSKLKSGLVCFLIEL